MSRTRSNTKIILQENGAYDRPTFERLSADANIYPGLLLVLDSAGKVDGAGDAHDGPWIVALENKYVCLLYTSPSPRDRTRSRMPSSA